MTSTSKIEWPYEKGEYIFEGSTTWAEYSSLNAMAWM